jgi:hypothetical protein
VFVEIILSESAESDIPLPNTALRPDTAFGCRQPKTVHLLDSQEGGKNRSQLFHLFMPVRPGNQDVFHCGAGSLVRGTSEDPYN